MRFFNETKKSRKLRKPTRFSEKPSKQCKFDLGKNEMEKLNAKIPHEVAVAIDEFKQVKGNQPETNNDLHGNMDIVDQGKEKDISGYKTNVCSESVKTPVPIVPMKDQTLIDMSKDVWTLGEILDLKISEIPFLVEKIIPLHTLNILAGQSERGKSTLYTQLALAIVRGDTEFLGCKLNTAHKKVIVVSTEDGPIALSFRANKQLSEAPSYSEYKDRLIFITNQTDLENRIERYLEKECVDLVVMDAFGDVFTGGDINASNSVRRYLDNYANFVKKYGCTVLFVHHVGKGKQGNKPEKDQLLGSTGIEGKMRNVLMLSIVNDQHQLSIAKGNYVKREDKKIPMYLNFDHKTLTFSRAEGPVKQEESNENPVIKSCLKVKRGKKRDEVKYNQAIQLFLEGKPQVEIARTVGKDKSSICKWIKEYKATG